LIEVLVSVTLALIVVAMAGMFFVASRNRMQDQVLHVETLQGLRGTVDSMVRDLRLGGACLPTTGEFITLGGVHGTTDQIVTRTGIVRPNETCIRTVLRQDAAVGDTQVQVEAAAGFTPSMRVYLRLSNNTTGAIVSVTGVDTTGNVLQLGAPLRQAFAKNSGVYALDERAYAVDTTDPSLPVLTVAVNGAPAMPFAVGIENLQIQYQLERNCDRTCDVVALPANDAEFALVRQIYITVTARSRTVGSDGQYYRVTRTVSAKPRNLMPG